MVVDRVYKVLTVVFYDLNTFTTDEAVIPTRGGDWYDGGLWQDDIPS